MIKAGKAHIGTSGWSYKHWKGPFYPADISDKNMFSHYARHFRTVEINSSFYHLPLLKTFENWRESSPPGFVFAVKASRYITHIKRLKQSAEAVDKFFERVVGLEAKTGPILFQLPPSLKIDAERIRSFLELLPQGYRYVFEFRNPSWFHPEIFSLLSDRGAALCLHELGGKKAPLELTADFVYARLHGPGGPYQGSYPREVLSEWAERLAGWMKDGLDCFCYFDNDEKGFAALNAAELRGILDG